MWPRAMTEPGVRAAPGPASVLFPSVHLFPGSEMGRLRPGPRRPVETLQTAPSPIQRRGGKRSLGPAHQAHTAEHGALASPRREPPPEARHRGRVANSNPAAYAWGGEGG